MTVQAWVEVTDNDCTYFGKYLIHKPIHIIKVLKSPVTIKQKPNNHCPTVGLFLHCFLFLSLGNFLFLVLYVLILMPHSCYGSLKVLES